MSRLRSVLSMPQYDDLVLRDVEVRTERSRLTRQVEGVVVTVGRPPGEDYPDLADDLAALVDAGLRIEVRFVDVRTA